MQTELKYNGYTAQPSDYECQDGELAAVINLSSKNGALHPNTQAKSILKLCYSHLKMVCIHKGAFGTNYIIYSTQTRKFYWLGSGLDASVWENYKTVNSGQIYSYYSVSCIGNVLMILTITGIQYYIWDISGYKDLGELPELNLQFGVKYIKSFGNFAHDGLATSGLPKDSQTGFVKLSSPYNLDETNQNAVTEALLAQANKAVASIHEAGYFIFPFFVRYAFRLFDGTTTRASAPVLICPSTLAPFIPMTYTGDRFGFHAYGYSLYYYLNDATELDLINKWKDLIVSIDIFISAPIYTYDQSGKCKRMLPADYISKSNGFYSIVDGIVAEVTHANGTAVFELPQFENLLDKFISNSSFYFYHSIPISELIPQKDTVIEAKENYMDGLVSRETLQDDYDSHDTYIAKGGFNYNARMNLYGMSKVKFEGFHPSLCFSRVNPGSRTELWVESGYWTSDYEEGRGDDTTQYWVDTSHYETQYWKDYWLTDCYVHIKTEGCETVMERCASENFSFGEDGFPRWFYYPDSKAYKAVFILRHIPDDQVATGQADVPVYVVELELKAHEYLNGAYYFNGFDAPDYKLITTYRWRVEEFDIRDVETSELLPDSCKPLSPVNVKLNLLNKIYTSDVNNPFSFSVININTIGNGEIIGVASAVKAMSQGQFGQFPLYAFTTDGIWALTVSTTGAFSAKQPITRDVCTDANSITQIDSAVLFASDRGIMLIAGSETQCISDVINNEGEPFSFSSMPLFSNINALLSFDKSVFSEIDFRSFIKGCQILYAYNRQQIIVFNQSCKYAYIYSLQDKTWSVIESSIKSKINSYPEALAMLENGELVDYSQEGDVNEHQFLITRPIKLGASLKDVNKTIDAIITRGNFEKGHVATVLYGSRDLRNWATVYTSKDHYLRHFRGTPYKYFRIALICSLTHDESIWGSTIQFSPRLTNKQR